MDEKKQTEELKVAFYLEVNVQLYIKAPKVLVLH